MNTYYLLGKAAFNDGKSRDDNPYEYGGPKWWEWLVGYRAAERYDLEE